MPFVAYGVVGLAVVDFIKSFHDKVFGVVQYPESALYFEDQGFLGTEVCTLAAFYAFVVVDDRRVKTALRQCADGAHLNCGTGVILRTVVFYQRKHFRHDRLLYEKVVFIAFSISKIEE